MKILFQRFEQVSASNRRVGGAGLGLAISRQLVRLMGSDIHLESRVGHGSRFWFDIDTPLDEVKPEAAAFADRAIIGYQGPRKKVLIVDDVLANRTVVVDLLAPLGFETMEAENGQDALDCRGCDGDVDIAAARRDGNPLSSVSVGKHEKHIGARSLSG